MRHKVERGETAFTIARLYNVPIKALAEWNGLGADFGIRSGQFLLIPVASQKPPMRTAAVAPALTPLPASVAPWSLVFALIVGAGVGITAGIYPASRASRLDPIAALRQE